jgi:hypothetical protein
MRPIHVWHSRMTAGVRCANFPSVITTIIDHSAVVETVEQTWVVCHVAESYAKQLNIFNLTKVNGIPETNSEKNTKHNEILLLTKQNETKFCCFYCFAKQAKFCETVFGFRFVSGFAKQKKGCEMETLRTSLPWEEKVDVYTVRQLPPTRVAFSTEIQKCCIPYTIFLCELCIL